MSLPRRLLAPIAGFALVIGGLAAPVASDPAMARSTTTPAASNGASDNAVNDDGDDPRHGTLDRVDLVVQFVEPAEYGPRELQRDHPVTLVQRLLPSRGIHLFRPADPQVAEDEQRARDLAEDIEKAGRVSFAEADSAVSLSDNRYHSWPKGDPRDIGRDRKRFRKQPLVTKLRLSEVHRVTKGAGVVVAVLDTGVARSHRELRDRLVEGYDYIGDDGNPAEVRSTSDENGNGIVDEGFGHGTFVAGIVALVAPSARILPMRVLDSDGAGSIFLVGQAIVDAVDRGADVVNLSLGTPETVRSRFFDAALRYAARRGVHVVAAAGNGDSDRRQYPATMESVLSVTSTKLNKSEASEFANWGRWVDVAAPADRLRGPVPGGRYARWAGTSMAAPQVSAQLALLTSLDRHPPRSDDDEAVTDQVGAVTRTARRVAGKEIRHGAVDILRSLSAPRKDDD